MRKGISLLGSLIVFAGAAWFAVSGTQLGGKGSPGEPLSESGVPYVSTDGVPAVIRMPASGKSVMLLTLNAENYFVPEDRRRSNLPMKFKPIEAREAVAALVEQSGADMVGLCEMGGEAAVKDLLLRVERKGMKFPYYVLLMRKGEDRGLAFLSKYPLVDRSVADVPVPTTGKRSRKMLRGVLDVTVKLDDGRMFRCLGVHLKSRLSMDGSAEAVRMNEARALREYLNRIMTAEEGMPLVVYGDMNDGYSCPSQKMVRGRGNEDTELVRLKAKDSRGERWTIFYDDDETYQTFDHVLVNRVLKKRLGRGMDCRILDSAEAAKASDHRGIRVELR